MSDQIDDDSKTPFEPRDNGRGDREDLAEYRQRRSEEWQSRADRKLDRIITGMAESNVRMAQQDQRLNEADKKMDGYEKRYNSAIWVALVALVGVVGSAVWSVVVPARRADSLQRVEYSTDSQQPRQYLHPKSQEPNQ
jgi:hypothetical protein